jgi:ribose transport system permease protein
MSEKNSIRSAASGFLSSVYSGPFIAILIIGIFLSLTSPQFLKISNFVNISNQIAINIILAVGMTILITSGGIDLSVGANVALTGVVVAIYFRAGQSEGSAIAGILLGLSVGTVLGLVNGLIVAYLKAPPFITTLGTMGVFRGLALILSGGRPLMGINDVFLNTFSGFIGPVPKQFLIALLLAALGGFILNRTAIGRIAQVMGGNEKTLRVSGIPIELYKVLMYVLTGVLAAIGGLVLTSMMAVAEPIAGQFYELDAVAVVVMGGTPLQGGKGTVLGTLLGAILLGIVRNGLNMLGVEANYQQLFIGLIIMIAVISGSRRKTTTQL